MRSRATAAAARYCCSYALRRRVHLSRRRGTPVAVVATRAAAVVVAAPGVRHALLLRVGGLCTPRLRRTAPAVMQHPLASHFLPSPRAAPGRVPYCDSVTLHSKHDPPPFGPLLAAARPVRVGHTAPASACKTTGVKRGSLPRRVPDRSRSHRKRLEPTPLPSPPRPRTLFSAPQAPPSRSVSLGRGKKQEREKNRERTGTGESAKRARRPSR